MRVAIKPTGADTPSAVARELWDAIAGADVASLQRILSPKTVWHMPGRSPLAGTFRGVDEVLAWMAKVGELSDELDSILIDVFTNDDGAVLRYGIQARRGDKLLETEHLFMIRIEMGQVTEAVFAPLDQERYDRFWLDEPRRSTRSRRTAPPPPRR